MKSEFTLNLMRWASELYTLDKPPQQEENAKLAISGPLRPEASAKTIPSVLPYSLGVTSSLLNAGMHRVLARYFGITTPIRTPAGEELYELLANALLDAEAPGLFSRAMVHFSEQICQPENPLCHQCVQRAECEAFRHGFTATLPVEEE